MRRQREERAKEEDKRKGDRGANEKRGWLLLLFAPSSLLSLSLLGCGRLARPGSEDVPPGLTAPPGVYTDVGPRWSHDGRQIAFLRATPDRQMQLHLIDPELRRPLALLEPEVLGPDRGYRSSLQNYCSGDSLAWSPNDAQIAFERTDNFTFEDGERLPGTGIWSLDLHTGRVVPLVLHPPRYESRFYFYHTPQWSPDGRYFAWVGEGINGQRLIGVRPLSPVNAQKVTPRYDLFEDSDWPIWRNDRGKKERKETDSIAYTTVKEAETALSASNMARKPDPVSSASLSSFPLASLWFRQSIRRASAVPPTETWRSLQPGRAHSEGCGEQWRIRAAEYARLLREGLKEKGEKGKEGKEKGWGGRADISQNPNSPLSIPVVPRIGHPTWSPDGTQFAFTLTPNANGWEQYEIWVLDAETRKARRISPKNGRGYFAPVWIGGKRIGALSPNKARFDVVVLDTDGQTRRTLGTIDSADCDWSPDRSRIVYAGSEPSEDSDAPSTLRLFQTGIGARGAVGSGATGAGENATKGKRTWRLTANFNR